MSGWQCFWICLCILLTARSSGDKATAALSEIASALSDIRDAFGL